METWKKKYNLYRAACDRIKAEKERGLINKEVTIHETIDGMNIHVGDGHVISVEFLDIIDETTLANTTLYKGRQIIEYKKSLYDTHESISTVIMGVVDRWRRLLVVNRD